MNIDLQLFERDAHNPSFGSLVRSQKKKGELLDFCVPVNPYFPPQEWFENLGKELKTVLRYYPDSKEPLEECLGKLVGVDAANIVIANGSTELITWIDHLFVKENIVVPVPTFGRWTDQPMETGKEVFCYRRVAQNAFQLDIDNFVSFVRRKRARAVAVCNPNNPTGALTTPQHLRHLLNQLADLDCIIIDESFIDFADGQNIPTMADIAVEYENVIVVKSLGKNFGLHGVRLGYAVANWKLARKLRMTLPHWNVNAVGEYLLRSLGQHFSQYLKSRPQVVADREYLLEKLTPIEGITVYPSQANFLYVKCDDDIDGIQLRNRLIDNYGIFLRECGNKIGSNSQHLRIAAKPKALVDQLEGALKETITALRQGQQVSPAGAVAACAEKMA